MQSFDHYRSKFGSSTFVLVPLRGFVLLSVAGCASAGRDIGASATPVVVHSALHEANTSDSQAQIQHLLDSPAIQKTGESIGVGVGIGLVNEANRLVADGTTASAATDAGSTTPTSGPTSALSEQGALAAKSPDAATVGGFASGGGLNRFVKSSVQEAFLVATDPQSRAGERAMSESIGEGFVQGMITVLDKTGPGLSDTIRKQLDSIVQDLIREQIAPAIQDMLKQQLAPLALQVWKEGAVETLKLTVRPDLQPDVMQNAENASIGASRGTHRALIESGLLNPSGELSSNIRFYLWITLGIVGIIVAATLSLLIMLNLLALHYWKQRNTRAVRPPVT